LGHEKNKKYCAKIRNLMRAAARRGC
jgi:hypothetical protein